MSVAFLFPGQGSQKVGMGRAFYDAFPLSRHIFECVDETLGYGLSAITFEGDPSDLTRTDRAQPALYTVSHAILAVIQDQIPSLWSHLKGMAGHSLGEYAALVHARSMTLEEGARLLAVRGEGMWRSGQNHPGGMVAVLGAGLEDVERVVHDVASYGICVIANDNAPGQVVLSGERAALDQAILVVKERLQKKAISLDVSGAFHSPLMASAADRLEESLHNVVWNQPQYPVIANVTAQPIVSAAAIPTLLKNQVCGRVRWRESIQTLYNQGIRTFIEIGSGKVLTGLCARILSDADITCLSIQTPHDLDVLTPWA